MRERYREIKKRDAPLISFGFFHSLNARVREQFIDIDREIETEREREKVREIEKKLDSCSPSASFTSQTNASFSSVFGSESN